MSKKVRLAVVSLALLSQGASARVIYGEDHRVEVYEATPFQQKLAQSAASMVSQREMTRDAAKPGLVQLTQNTLSDWLASQDDGGGDESPKYFTPKLRAGAKAKAGTTFCESERFTDQPNPAMCSGFLIAPDLIVTAGHCVEIPSFCSEYRWVFGFQVNPETKKAGVDIKEEDIYKCKKVVSNALANPLGLDYAVVQLDRRVTGREPLEIRNDSNVADKASLVVIGSPSGLPLKVAAGANVRDNIHPFYFNANLDTFQGNSGSGVINAVTGVVEGILVRGENDFVGNMEKMCVEANKCADDDCMGEEVTRMTAIPEIGIQNALNRAAFAGDVATLKKLLKLNVWVDFYSKDGQSSLMKAVQAGKIEAAQFLITRGADVNLQDGLGNSSLHHLAKNLNDSNAELLAVLLASKANLELKNNNGETALNLAATSLNLDGVKALIKNGALANATDNNGETVLFAFTRQGNVKAVKELIELGVSATIANNEGITVLDLKDPRGKVVLKKLKRKLIANN